MHTLARGGVSESTDVIWGDVSTILGSELMWLVKRLPHGHLGVMWPSLTSLIPRISSSDSQGLSSYVCWLILVSSGFNEWLEVVKQDWFQHGMSGGQIWASQEVLEHNQWTIGMEKVTYNVERTLWVFLEGYQWVLIVRFPQGEDGVQLSTDWNWDGNCHSPHLQTWLWVNQLCCADVKHVGDVQLKGAGKKP